MGMRASDQTTSQDSQGAAATGSQTQGADSAWAVVPLMPNQGHRDGILLLSSREPHLVQGRGDYSLEFLHMQV